MIHKLDKEKAALLISSSIFSAHTSGTKFPISLYDIIKNGLLGKKSFYWFINILYNAQIKK